MNNREAYRFQSIPEAAWIGLISTLAGFITMVMTAFGASAEVTAGIALAVPLTLRFIIGLAYGTYEFKALWEIAWVGLTAAAGTLAFAITQQNDVDGVTSTWAIATVMSVARAGGAAVLTAAAGKFEGPTRAPPAPTF